MLCLEKKPQWLVEVKIEDSQTFYFTVHADSEQEAEEVAVQKLIEQDRVTNCRIVSIKKMESCVIYA
ncbi:MAG: hypothetical protein ACPLSN_03640 [Dictyoglomus turgidum]